MNTVYVSVDPSVSNPLPMRNILGMNNQPTIQVKKRYQLQKDWFAALKLRHLRHHDAALADPGLDLIDVNRIFPLFHLDENDPKNYRFEQTDDYLSCIADLDLEIDFRLGESIDHSGFARYIQPPKDPGKWARICRNIVAHYKNGENNGMHLNITRVTVWEEADNSVLFAGTVEQYSALYCAVYKLFHKEFPGIQVGGPTVMSNGYEFMDGFLRICKENSIIPDFVTITHYTRNLNTIPDSVRKLRSMLDGYGFFSTRVIVSEWHLGPTGWQGNLRDIDAQGFTKTTSAAFAASTLIRLLDIEYLDAAFFYAWGNGPVWAAFTQYPDMFRRPSYFGLLFFNQMAVECRKRLSVQWDGAENISVLSGQTDAGKVRLLVSCYETDTTAFTCRVKGAVSCTMKVIRNNYCENDCTEGIDIAVDTDGTVTFAQESDGSDVFLLEFSLAE